MDNDPRGIQRPGPARASLPPPSSEETRPAKARAGLCIVGMGGSAGGLEAFEQFFSHLPPGHRDGVHPRAAS